LFIIPGGTQKRNLLHKAGGRVVYFGYKDQRKVERGWSKKTIKLKEIQTCPREISQEEIRKVLRS